MLLKNVFIYSISGIFIVYISLSFLDLKEKLQKQIEEQNVAKTFTLLGPKENPYPYIKNCDAFCLLSNYEGYGMVIDEAKILNKFICITNTAAREALLDYPGNSRIVQNNEEGIEDGIKYIVKNKQKIASKKIEYHLENDKTIEKICKMINLYTVQLKYNL